jgi:cell division septum initiation protein DivIVA
MITLEQKIEMFKSDLKENEDLKKENEDLKNRLKKINDILNSRFIIGIFNRNKINVVSKTIFDIIEGVNNEKR